MRRIRAVMVEYVGVRMPQDLADLLDEYVTDMQRRMGDDYAVKRSDVIRILLSRSLRNWRAQRPGQSSSKGSRRSRRTSR
jgi:hypothetical protein